MCVWTLNMAARCQETAKISAMPPNMWSVSCMCSVATVFAMKNSWHFHFCFNVISCWHCVCIENVGGESLVCYGLWSNFLLRFFFLFSFFYCQPLLFVIVHFHFVWITALDQESAECTMHILLAEMLARCTRDNCINRFSITQQLNSGKCWKKWIFQWMNKAM